MSFQVVMGFVSAITLFICSWWIWRLEQNVERLTGDRGFMAIALNFSLLEITCLQDALAANNDHERMEFLEKAMAMAEKRRDAFEERFSGADKFPAQEPDMTIGELKE